MSESRSMPDREFELEQFLPYRLQRLSALLTADFFAGLAARGECGWPEWSVLSSMSRAPLTTARDISARTGLGKTAISRAVQTLEKAGWLVRNPDAADRRMERLALTEAGQVRHGELARAAADYAARLLKLCGADDAARMHQLLCGLEDFILAGFARSA